MSSLPVAFLLEREEREAEAKIRQNRQRIRRRRFRRALDARLKPYIALASFDPGPGQQLGLPVCPSSRRRLCCRSRRPRIPSMRQVLQPSHYDVYRTELSAAFHIRAIRSTRQVRIARASCIRVPTAPLHHSPCCQQLVVERFHKRSTY